jgi:hypothetical protein
MKKETPQTNFTTKVKIAANRGFAAQERPGDMPATPPRAPSANPRVYALDLPESRSSARGRHLHVAVAMLVAGIVSVCLGF